MGGVVDPATASARPSTGVRTAFTFTEILFSLIILGIGFIMLAAIFPVALQQTKVSTEDTTSAAIARSALRYMEDLGQQKKSDGTAQLASTSGVVKPIIANDSTDGVAPKRWDAISGNMIVPNDPRFAWVPLYSRASGSPFAQIFVFVEQVRGDRAQFDSGDLTGTTPNLQARTIKVVSIKYTDGTDLNVATLDKTSSALNAIGEGSYLIVSTTGRIYRLAAQLANDSSGNPRWQIAPGYELKSDGTEDLTSATDAFVVGRFSTDGGATATGPVQDIGCYTSFVRVN